MKTMYPENFILSAKAPRIKAGVITANMHWNMANSSSGIFPAAAVSSDIPFMNTFPKPPIRKDRGFPFSSKLVSNTQL